MIKLPKTIVVYPQRLTRPEFLLCWIPPAYYKDVAVSPAARKDLKKYYPEGLELELTEAALKDAGVKLAVSAAAIREAYRDLAENDLVHSSGMVEVDALQGFVKEKERGRTLAEIQQPGVPGVLSAEEAPQPDILKKIKKRPRMTGGEDPGNVFNRLSGHERE